MSKIIRDPVVKNVFYIDFNNLNHTLTLVIDSSVCIKWRFPENQFRDKKQVYNNAYGTCHLIDNDWINFGIDPLPKKTMAMVRKYCRELASYEPMQSHERSNLEHLKSENLREMKRLHDMDRQYKIILTKGIIPIVINIGEKIRPFTWFNGYRIEARRNGNFDIIDNEGSVRTVAGIDGFAFTRIDKLSVVIISRVPEA